jgi:hypothetical protein
MTYGVDQVTGEPGRKRGVGGISAEHAAFEAETAAVAAVTGHEADSDPHTQYATDADLAAHTAHADPHPQYTTDAEVEAALPRFVTHWKWS